MAIQTIREFAERYRVTTKRDTCAEEIIPGRQYAKDMPTRQEYRCHVYDHGDGKQFGVCLLYLPDGPSGKSRKWTSVRKRLIASGFEPKQTGDAEGTLLFDPKNEAQARLALNVCRVRAHRNLSDADRQARAERASRLASLKPRQETIFPAIGTTTLAA